MPVSSSYRITPEGVDVGPGVHVQGVERRPAPGPCTAACPVTLPNAVNSVCSVSCSPLVALASPKSITFGTGLPSWLSTRMFGRLQVAVDDPLLVGVLHRRADLHEQVEPVRDARAGGRRRTR